MPVRWPKSETCEASAATRPWSSSAVGRSWRASVSSSSIAWLTSSWVCCSSERRPHGASWIVADRRRRIAVSAWLTSSWRSCAIRQRSCSCARRTARPASRRSASRRASMRLKASVSSCSSFAARPGASARMPGRARSTSVMARTSRSIGSSRARISSELSRIALETVSPSTSRPSPLVTSGSRSRATIAAMSAVTPTRRALTARTCVRSVLRRIGTVRSSSAEAVKGLCGGGPHAALYFLKY